MKVAVIMGSRREGNTYKVVKALEETLSAQMGTVTPAFAYFWPEDYLTPHCISCYQCFMRGEHRCPHQETIQPVVRAMDEADIIVLATPIFSLQVTADLKNFIDHVSYMFHRSRYAGKKGVAIATTAGGGHKDVSAYLAKILGSWGSDKVYEIPVQCLSLDYEIKPKISQRIERVAGQLAADYREKKVYPGKLSDAFMFKIWHSISLSNEDTKNADRIFWEEIHKGGYRFYPNGRLRWGTQLLADVLFGLMSKLIFKENSDVIKPQ